MSSATFLLPSPALSGVLASAVLDAVLRVNSESQAAMRLAAPGLRGRTPHSLLCPLELSSESFLAWSPILVKGRRSLNPRFSHDMLGLLIS